MTSSKVANILLADPELADLQPTVLYPADLEGQHPATPVPKYESVYKLYKLCTNHRTNCYKNLYKLYKP